MKKIFYVCIISACLAMVRFTTYAQTVSLDTSFGSAGIVITSIDSSNAVGTSTAIQLDGKIVVAGYADNGANRSFALLRYDTNGNLDNSFGTMGIVKTAIGNSNDAANAVALQVDGKILVAGYSRNGFNYDFALVRYNSDGNLDNTFDADGIVTTDLGGSSEKGNAIAIQDDGKILVSGYRNLLDCDFAIVRYNSDGSVDTTFGINGITITNFGNEDIGTSIAILNTGKILVAGYSGNNGLGISDDFALACYNSNGNLDSTFGTNGMVITDLGSWYDYCESIAVQNDGKIVLAGYVSDIANPDFALVRYNNEGSLDTTFGVGGIVTTNFGNSSDQWGYSVAIQDDGKILLAGDNNSDFALLRYNSDGSLDNSFGTAGMINTNVGIYGSGHAVAIQADGKILVVGYGYNNIFNKYFAAVRYTVCSIATSNITITAYGNYTVPSGDETYNESGIYMDTIANAGGCDSIITINLTIKTVGIEDPNSAIDIKVFSDFENKQLIVSANKLLTHPSFILHNQIGQTVIKKEATNKDYFTIDISKQPAGVYVYSLVVDGLIIYSNQLIIE